MWRKGTFVKCIKTVNEYRNFTHCISECSITTYRVEISSGIAQVKESIHITSDLHVKLSFESSPVPLPDLLRIQLIAKLLQK